ncbi:MAG: xanthine dehydrogenase small subunit [Burkholderiales bacterium]
MTVRPSPAKSTDAVRFILDGEVHTARVTSPTRTLLQYLREDLARIGTKEGCAEGDCGACTVVIAERHDPGLRFRAVNACIQFLPTLDGKALFTVESLKDRQTGALHPVQQAMADGHGAQCGFCTPGFVMSLFALYKSDAAPDRTAINDALAGNLCRCTGYRPIVDAAIKMRELGNAIPENQRDVTTAPAGAAGSIATEASLRTQLEGLARRGTLRIKTAHGTFHAPRSVAALARLRHTYPETRILAGGTDVGLWVTKQLRDLGDLLYIGEVSALQKVVVRGGAIDIGAAVSLTDAFAAIERHIPAMRELMRRFASPPIRNAGTLVGNIANGSPIGDSMPALMALGAKLILASASAPPSPPTPLPMVGEGRVHRREVALEDFYLAYQKTALQSGELVERVVTPIPSATLKFATYKISKRFDQDISSVCAAFALEVVGGTVRVARVAFGGMAATPKRAARCEAALISYDWTEATCEAAAHALASDFSPLSDMRASASYRLRVAQNLLRKFFVESTGRIGAVPTRLYDFSEAPA